MTSRLAVPVAALVVALSGGISFAESKVAPVAKLAPLCEAHITMVNQKTEPGTLPVKLLTGARLKVGPYVPLNAQKKLGGVKVTTVMTGTIEYQEGTARALAPFICMGTDKEVGFHYVSTRAQDGADLPVVPVQDCYLKYVGAGDQASACIKDALTKSETDLAAAVSAGKAKLTPETGDYKNFEASQTEFEAYRKRSCNVFEAPDASTDAVDFLNACVARLNLTRAAKLMAPPPPAPASTTPAPPQR